MADSHGIHAVNDDAVALRRVARGIHVGAYIGRVGHVGHSGNVGHVGDVGRVGRRPHTAPVRHDEPLPLGSPGADQSRSVTDIEDFSSQLVLGQPFIKLMSHR